MKPTLFTIPLPGGGEVPVYPFFFLIMVGALIATFFLMRICRRAGLKSVVALDMGIIAIVASIIGMRVFHILFEYPSYYWEHPWRVFDFLSGGFVSLGAFIATIFAWLYYLRKRGLPVIEYFDQAARAVFIIIVAVRLGCLLTGCCYGRPTDFFFHLVFPPGSTAHYFMGSEALHATQVYFIISGLLMGAVMQWVYKRRKFPGQVVASFLIYYGITRFFIEFFRGDADRGVYLESIIPPYGISTGQIVVLIFLVAGIMLHRRFAKMASRAHAAA